MSKGGSDTQTVKQEIDPDVKAAYLNNLDYAKDVGNNLGVQQFADFNPQYQAGEQQMMAAAQGGAGMQNLNTAADLSRAAAGYSPQNVYGASAGPAAMSGYTGYNATDMGAAQFDPNRIGQYFNPYQQNVIDRTQASLETQRQQALNQTNQQAMQAKAFGGSRQGVAQALTNQAWGTTAANTLANLQQQGYNDAMGQYQQDLGRQQQAYSQNAAQRTGASQFGAGAANQAALANQAAANNMNQYNASMYQQANLANQQAGLQGAQFRLGAANQLGAIGQQQTAGQYQAAQNLMGLGGARQQLQQQQLDAQRNLALQRLNINQSALGLQPGNLGGSSTQPMYQNTGANMLGGAMAGASLAGMLPASMGVSAGMGAGAGALMGLI